MSAMQLVDGVTAILAIFLYILLLAVLSLGILVVIAAGIGLIGSLLSVPLLYVLPDVRRFLVLASGGEPDDETPPWRVALRPRYLLLSMAFGVGYGVTFLLLFIPVREFGLIHARVGPVPLLLGIPLAFVVLALPFAYVAQSHSRARAQTSQGRSVLCQWAVFLSVTVAVGTTVTVLLATW